MGRILAIDYGSRRTGIAVSDPLRIIASPLETIPTPSLMAFIEGYLAREMVDIIVLGQPRQMDGSPSETWPAIEALAGKLRAKFAGVKIDLEDERFTSVLAQKAIVEGGVRKMARRDKALVDKVSAAIILQSYMSRL